MIERAHLAAVRDELLRDCAVISESDMLGSNKVLFVVEHPTLRGYVEPVIDAERGEQAAWSDDMQRRFVFRGWRAAAPLAAGQVRGRLAHLWNRKAALDREIAQLERELPDDEVDITVPSAAQRTRILRGAPINPFPTPEGGASPVAAPSLESSGKVVEMS